MGLHYANVWERVADTIGDVDAVVQGDRRLTYAQYEEQAARFAAALGSSGVAPGTNVSLYLYNCPEYLVAQFGTFKHEGVAINVNYRYLDDELVYLVDNSDSGVVVFHTSLGDRVSRVMDRLPDVRLWIEVDDGGDHVDGAVSFDDLIASNDPAPRRDLDPAQSYMLYTGGTTGMPKGVMYEHHTHIQGGLDAVQAAIPSAPIPTTHDEVPAFVRFLRDNGAAQVAVPCCPLMHGTGMWVGAMPILVTGGTVVLLEARSFDAHELLDVIEREAVTRPVIVGDAFGRPIVRALQAEEAQGRSRDLSSVTSIISSGAMWSAEIKEAMTERFTDAVLIDGLGSTEGGGFARVDTTKGTQGTTAKFTLAPTTLLLDEDDQIVPRGSGQRGLLASLTGARGYFKDPEKTARTFREIDGKWYVITGDWATEDEDGSITLHGRGSNCINSGGEKIFPEEVEEALKTHAAVDDCYVIGVDDERFGQRVVAVAGCGSAQLTEIDLRDHLRSRLSGFKIPKEIVIVDEVHRAPNGKADYGWAREVAAGAR